MIYTIVKNFVRKKKIFVSIIVIFFFEIVFDNENFNIETKLIYNEMHYIFNYFCREFKML